MKQSAITKKMMVRAVVGGALAFECVALFCAPVCAQEVFRQETGIMPVQSGPLLAPVISGGPVPITIDLEPTPIEQKLERQITLDVREMNVVDVIKFLALKGDFNVVTSPLVTGRITLYLKSVSIKDVFDIILISNGLAYSLQNDIVYITTEDEYVRLHGKRFSDRRQVKIFQLKYARPSYALTALEGIKSALGKIIIDEDTGSVVLIDTPNSLAQMQAALSRIESPLETYVYSLQYARADVVAEKLRGRIEGTTVGSIIADERSNQLVLRALPGRRAEIEEVIRSLDTKTKAVLIEGRVMQVTFKPQLDFGIDWNLDFRDSPDKELRKLSIKNVYLDEENLTTSSNLKNIFAKIAVGDFNSDAFDASIRALKQVSDTKILSNPKLLVTNNQEARIHVGDTVPYIVSTTSGTGDNAITSEDVRFIDVGLKLLVTPTINDDGFVTMRLKPEISTVVAMISSKGGGIPQVNKTEVETTVIVKDGNTIIMGGLKKDDKSAVKKGFPFLMDIPVLGWMFRSQSDSITSSEIIIFITPHIVDGTEDYEHARLRGTLKPLRDYDEGVIDDTRK